MFRYNPSSRSQDYTSYLPRRSYLPTSFDIDDAPLTGYPPQDLGYASLSQSFLAPRIDAETRYRRALYELEAAEQEYKAHKVLERARQVAAIRHRAAAETARREREIALYAEIERIKRARALQEQAEERLAQRERAVRTQVGFGRAHRGRHPLMQTNCGDAETDYVAQGHPCRLEPNKETLGIEDVLDLFSGIDRERQGGSRPQRRSSRCSQPHAPAEPHAQAERREHENAEVNFSNILELFRSIAAEARGAASGEQSTHDVRLFV